MARWHKTNECSFAFPPYFDQIYAYIHIVAFVKRVFSITNERKFVSLIFGVNERLLVWHKRTVRNN